MSERPYPTRDGVPIKPVELWQDLSPEGSRYTQEFNIHHMEWEARSFGRFALYRTLRNLDSLQVAMPVDQHNALHKIFDQPLMPTPEQAMDLVVEAYETKQALRFGALGKPVFKLIQAEDMKIITREYNELR